MRKVTKILLKTLSAIIILLIILPVLATMLLSMPSIQNRAVRFASDFATEALGTTVSIGSITAGMWGGINVRDFYVEDYDGDTLLYAASVTAHLGDLRGMPRNLILNVGKARDVKFILRETTRGPMNIKEVVDRINRNKKKKGRRFRLDIRSLDAENLCFRLERLKHRNPKFGVDYGNMRFDNIHGHLDNFYVDSSAVGGLIRHLEFIERSGFVLHKGSGHFHVDKGLVKLDDFSITSDGTYINLPKFSLTGRDWSEYKEFIKRVRIDGEAVDSYADSYTVGYWAPAIRRWQTSISEANFSMHGTVANFRGEIDHLRLEDGGHLKAAANIKGLTNVRKTTFDVDVKKIKVSTPELSRLLGTIARLNIPEKVQPYIDRTQSIEGSGRFKGYISDFTAVANIAVGSGGQVEAQCNMDSNAGVRTITAQLATDALNVGNITAIKTLGEASLSASAKANIDDGNIEADGEVKISDIVINDYNYRNATIVAQYADSRIETRLDTDDENLQAELTAAIDTSNREEPTFEVVADIRHADLHAMNINKRDSIATLSASAAIEATGRSIDELGGMVSIADATYTHNDTTINSERVSLNIDANEDIRTITLNSDFADAVFESRSPYKDVVYYLRTLLSHYLPQLYDKQSLGHIETKGESMRNNVALLSVTTKQLDPLIACFTSGIEVAPQTSIKVFMNPAENHFMMRGKSDYISSNRFLLTEMDLTAGNRNDSLTLDLLSKDIYLGGMRAHEFNLHGGAKNNELHIFTTVADSTRDFKGELAASAAISRRDSMRHVSITLQPSSFRRKEQVWRVTANGIEANRKRIDIRDFRISNRNDQQELSLDGVASRSLSDTLHLELKNFSLAPFTQFAERIGYVIEGRTNGYANVSSALRDTEIDAKIDLDSIRINSIPIAAMQLSSRWDFGRSRASLSVCTRNNGEEIIRGYYSPSQVRYYARIQMPALKMSLLDPMLKGVISKTKGSAKVDLTLSGERRMADLSGNIEVTDLETMLDYTRCVYSAPKATIEVKNNRFTVSNAPIYDIDRNRGTLSMNLSLNHLSNIEYDFDVRFRSMRVLSTTKRDNDMFYGKVFASGSAAIRGDKAGVVMDFVASTDDNSHFYMPLSGKSNISSADFVTFEQATKLDTTNVLVRKKLSFERRQRQRSSSGGAMDINMSLNVRPNAEVQLVIDPTVGDIIKGRGEGLLNLRINPKSDIFEMYGDYTIDEGSYLFTLQNIINKRFVIERGSTIQWTGDPLDALLNIDAIYRLKASLKPLLEGYISQDSHSIPSRAVPVECIIHLKERLTRPAVTFDVRVDNTDSSIQSIVANALSTPERRSQQFLYLLVANSFLSDASTDASLFGASSAAVTGFELLSNQLSNWLSTESSNIVLRYRPKTEQMMSDEVDFGFSKGLFNNRLLIELEGNYLVDKSQVVNANSSLTGEAYVTWLIDRAGTLRLKGFTHTIDRFDENQGLQETGIGIYYKEDFDNAKDLRQRIANRFSRKRRQRNEARISEALAGAEEAMQDMEAYSDAPPQELPDYD